MEGNLVHPCEFRWDIHNPFVPWRTLEATFYSGFPHLTQWRVTVKPTARRVHRLFTFSLKGEQFDEFDEIPTRLVRVVISLDGRSVAREEVENYCFEQGNQQTFSFQQRAVVSPQLETQCLTIVVEIHLPGFPTIGAGGRAMAESDLVHLSKDLSRILNDQRYSNMRLLPIDVQDLIHVHSYILAVRWENFFRVYGITEHEADTVQTDIPWCLLWDVLTYIYSGELHTYLPEWGDAEYVKELFRVIDQHKLYHLYRVFVKLDSQQLRETRRALVNRMRSFPLEEWNGTLVDGARHTWRDDQVPACSFEFRMRVFRDEEGPALSYTLQSRSPRGIHALVHLEFVRETANPSSYKRVSVHEADYDLNPGESATHGRVALEGESDHFADFDTDARRVPRGSKLRHCVLCCLSLSDGQEIVWVRNVLENTMQDDRERLGALSDHMHKLLTSTSEYDLTILCHSEVPADPNNPEDKVRVEDSHCGHMAIFTTRVPAYWRVLQNVPRHSDIPTVVKCPVRSEAFRHVLLYIYTGTVLSFPMPFLDEVSKFAQRSEFQALMNLVARMRHP